ncbi:YpzG family protein [Evansella sp. AB-P1]|uniref:YpzG family protein n=1 Tax=Evansella sp. AB-P1 TaxID=3037653 RepID=UPI00241CF880|nr:YpzG family protein [Evansella sp. AB-P1]MDG5786236.1 YpzG family protein [Evansella sp. AB-P1]
MSKKNLPQSGKFHYKDPFHDPRANPKHAFHQVNGETEQSLHNRVLEVQTRKRS